MPRNKGCCEEPLCGYSKRCEDRGLYSEAKTALEIKLKVYPNCLENTLLALSDNGVNIEAECITACKCYTEVKFLTCQSDVALQILESLLQQGTNVSSVQSKQGLVLRLDFEQIGDQPGILTRTVAAVECAGYRVLCLYETIRDCELFLSTDGPVEEIAELFVDGGITGEYCEGGSPADCVTISNN